MKIDTKQASLSLATAGGAAVSSDAKSARERDDSSRTAKSAENAGEAYKVDLDTSSRAPGATTVSTSEEATALAGKIGKQIGENPRIAIDRLFLFNTERISQLLAGLAG